MSNAIRVLALAAVLAIACGPEVAAQNECGRMFSQCLSQSLCTTLSGHERSNEDGEYYCRGDCARCVLSCQDEADRCRMAVREAEREAEANRTPAEREEAAREEAARLAAEEIARLASGRPCEISGYPNANPDEVPNLGFAWCPAEVDFQVRSYAIAAAGTYCAKLAGDPGEDWAAQIAVLCDGLDDMDRLRDGDGPGCACPADMR